MKGGEVSFLRQPYLSQNAISLLQVLVKINDAFTARIRIIMHATSFAAERIRQAFELCSAK